MSSPRRRSASTPVAFSAIDRLRSVTGSKPLFRKGQHIPPRRADFKPVGPFSTAAGRGAGRGGTAVRCRWQPLRSTILLILRSQSATTGPDRPCRNGGLPWPISLRRMRDGRPGIRGLRRVESAGAGPGLRCLRPLGPRRRFTGPERGVSASGDIDPRAVGGDLRLPEGAMRWRNADLALTLPLEAASRNRWTCKEPPMLSSPC
jgi:hypothetical protein